MKALRSSLIYASLVALCALSGVASSGAAEHLLVDDGRPRAEIVLGDKPARMAKLAAKELQTYVAKISGAKLEIVAAPSGKSIPIYVGKSRYTEELQLSVAGLENGAFRMASDDAWLALLGPDEDYVPIEPWGRKRSSAEAARVNLEWDKTTNDTFWNNCNGLYARYHQDLDVWDFDDTGTLNAVHEFLRSLGVRWYAPGELGEVVPELKTVALPKLDRVVVPDFALRRLSYYTDHIGLGELGIWGLRLGLHQAHKIIGVTQPGHGIKFVLWREEMKKTHPEMYLLKADGKRDLTHKGTGAPCLSSTMLREKQLKYSRAMFDYYHQPMLSIDMVDGYGGMNCTCPDCRKLFTPERGWRGSMSDYVWGYLNGVASELHKSHPDRLVSGLAYSAYKDPPTKLESLSPNLAIVECRGRSKFHDPKAQTDSREVRESWLAKLPSKKYFTWDYYLHAVPEDVGRPVFFPRIIAADLRELKDVSLGDTIEVYQHRPGEEANFGYDPLAAEHLNIYVTSRLWWDAEQDLDALLEDYYAGYYGPAQAQMKAFVEYSEQNWMMMNLDPTKIAEAFKLLGAAQAAVSSESAYGKRIAKIADLMKPLRALEQLLARKHESAYQYRVLETWQAGGKPMKDKPLDGKLAKEFWPDVRVSSFASVLPSTRVDVPGEFRVLREGDMLYFGIRCAEPNLRGATIESRGNDDLKLLDGDYVSLLLETPGRSYYEIAVNSAGHVLEIDRGQGGDLKWSSSSQVAVHRGDGFWSVEVRLPIAGEGARLLDPLTGVDGAQPKEIFPWYFNVCRQRVNGKTIERTAFSPTGSQEFRVTEKFAKLWGK